MMFDFFRIFRDFFSYCKSIFVALFFYSFLQVNLYIFLNFIEKNIVSHYGFAVAGHLSMFYPLKMDRNH